MYSVDIGEWFTTTCDSNKAPKQRIAVPENRKEMVNGSNGSKEYYRDKIWFMDPQYGPMNVDMKYVRRVDERQPARAYADGYEVGYRQALKDFRASLDEREELIMFDFDPPCNNYCTTASDLGASEYGDMMVYPDPICPRHG